MWPLGWEYRMRENHDWIASNKFLIFSAIFEGLKFPIHVRSSVKFRSARGQTSGPLAPTDDRWMAISKNWFQSHSAVRSSPWLPDGYSQIFRLYVFGPLGFWTMALLRYTAKFDPFLSLDCAPQPSTPALEQSKERKGSNFAIWQPCFRSSSVCQIDWKEEGK